MNIFKKNSSDNYKADVFGHQIIISTEYIKNVQTWLHGPGHWSATLAKMRSAFISILRASPHSAEHFICISMTPDTFMLNSLQIKGNNINKTEQNNSYVIHGQTRTARLAHDF